VRGRGYSATRFLELVNSYCTPALHDLSYEEIECDGNMYGVVTLPPSPHLHYCTKDVVTPKRTWPKNILLVRHGEQVGVASPDEMTRLRTEKSMLSTIPQAPPPPDPLRGVNAVLINTPLDFKETMGAHATSHELLFKASANIERDIRNIIKDIFQDLPLISHDELNMVMTYLDGIEEPLARLAELDLELFCMSVPTTRKGADGSSFVFRIAYYFIIPKDCYFLLNGTGLKIHKFSNQCRAGLVDFAQFIKQRLPIQVFNGVAIVQQFEESAPWCPVCCKAETAVFDAIRSEQLDTTNKQSNGADCEVMPSQNLT
jgi:hypothetical protein